MATSSTHYRRKSEPTKAEGKQPQHESNVRQQGSKPRNSTNTESRVIKSRVRKRTKTEMNAHPAHEPKHTSTLSKSTPLVNRRPGANASIKLYISRFLVPGHTLLPGTSVSGLHSYYTPVFEIVNRNSNRPRLSNRYNRHFSCYSITSRVKSLQEGFKLVK